MDGHRKDEHKIDGPADLLQDTRTDDIISVSAVRSRLQTRRADTAKWPTILLTFEIYRRDCGENGDGLTAADARGIETCVLGKQ